MNHQQKNVVSVLNTEVTMDLYKTLLWETTLLFYKHGKTKIRWHTSATRSTSSYNQIIIAKIAAAALWPAWHTNGDLFRTNALSELVISRHYAAKLLQLLKHSTTITLSWHKAAEGRHSVPCSCALPLDEYSSSETGNPVAEPFPFNLESYNLVSSIQAKRPIKETHQRKTKHQKK